MKINDYDFGRIVIDDTEYSTDILIFPDRVEDNWWRRKGHELNLEDIQEILLKNPKVLVIGTGYSGRMVVSESVVKEISSRGIKVIIEPTKEAVEIYNKLVEKEGGEKVITAAFHLTC
jgi:hypothetical protein